MASATWKGNISFGLVNIPVALTSAEERSDFGLRMIDSRNNAPIRYKRVNEETGEEVPWGYVVKAYEYEDGKFVLLTEEDLKKAAPAKTQAIDIEAFVDAKAVGLQYFEKPYYVVPGKGAEKAYALLREALRRSGKLGIARVVLHARQYMAAVSVLGPALTLNLLRFEEELKPLPVKDLPSEKTDTLKITERELDLAQQLVAAMEADWKPEQYKDEYRSALMDWIERKVASGGTTPIGELEDEPAKETAGNVIDMMALLKASMKAKEGDAEKPKTRKKRAG